MKIFKCDNCNKEFGGPLDEIMHKDEHGIWHTFDLCAPCRQTLDIDVEKPKKDFFDKLIKKDN